MKLYTEEQVINIVNENFDEGCSNLNELKPIELPSEEEIEKESEIYPYGGRDGSKRNAFIKGAKWVIEQIKQQGNGN